MSAQRADETALNWLFTYVKSYDPVYITTQELITALHTHTTPINKASCRLGRFPFLVIRLVANVFHLQVVLFGAVMSGCADHARTPSPSICIDSRLLLLLLLDEVFAADGRRMAVAGAGSDAQEPLADYILAATTVLRHRTDANRIATASTKQCKVVIRSCYRLMYVGCSQHRIHTLLIHLYT